MNILHAYPHMLAPGGRPADSRALISGLAQIGHRTGAVYLPRPHDEEIVTPDTPVALYPLDRGLQSLSNFHRAVEAFDPDIVHFTGGPRHPVQNLWAYYLHIRGIPFVVSGGGNLSHPTFIYRWGGKPNRWYHTAAKYLFYLACDRPMLRRAAAVHAAAGNEAAIARRLGPSPVVIVPFGIDQEWITDRSNIQRRRLERPVTFAYLGRLSIIHKGLDLVLEAFGKLVQRGYGDAFRLILAGTSENGSLSRLRRRADELNIRHVTFPGGTWGAEKDELWTNADFYLHMARFNGFARAPREALGQGLPLITTRESDLGDWVEQYDMGAVAPLTPDALAQQLTELLALDRTRYQSMTQNAWKFARDNNWKAVARQMTREYEKLIGKRLNAPAE